MTTHDEITSPGQPALPSDDLGALRKKHDEHARDLRALHTNQNVGHAVLREEQRKTEGRVDELDERTAVVEEKTAVLAKGHEKLVDATETMAERQSRMAALLARKAADPILAAKADAAEALRLARDLKKEHYDTKLRERETRADLVDAVARHITGIQEQADANFAAQAVQIASLKDDVTRLAGIAEARDRKQSSVRWDREAREGLAFVAQQERDAELKLAAAESKAAAEKALELAARNEESARRTEELAQRTFRWKVGTALVWLLQGVIALLLAYIAVRLGIDPKGLPKP